MLTHYGPSSGAPFANLLVLEAGLPAPIFKTNGFSMQGGDEATLASLAAELFEQNKQELQNFKHRVLVVRPRSTPLSETFSFRAELKNFVLSQYNP